MQKTTQFGPFSATTRRKSRQQPTVPEIRIGGAGQRQMIAKPAKRQKLGPIWCFFADSAIPFALPSPPQPAYPCVSGTPVSAGTSGSFCFFDSAETT
jgi:hypothetical protein